MTLGDTNFSHALPVNHPNMRHSTRIFSCWTTRVGLNIKTALFQRLVFAGK